jgi:malonyl-CoA/methylmalonyl-CoA synthetase
VAVPLSPTYPAAELAWFCADAGAAAAIVGEEHAELLQLPRTLRPRALATAAVAPIAPAAPAGDALLLYTSGTTGRPKGARLTHENLAAQTRVLREAWGLSPDDRLLHALPLHHLHGLVVSLLATLAAGGAVRMLPRFDAARVVAELPRATVWMGVPTMYHRLRERGDDAALRAAAAGLRLATSGSAALPATLAGWWQGVHGAIPLERYGMTEIGIALSNPLDPAGRRPGHVGSPLPGFDVRIEDGELWVRGPCVFAGYHGRAPHEGWFQTGDVAERSPEGAYRLLGRTSVDILKSGGEKISAVAIEETLRDCPGVADVAVFGVPDEAWGERVVAAVIGDVTVERLREFARAHLAAHQVPRELHLVDDLPRNPLGKVQKPELKARYTKA